MLQQIQRKRTTTAYLNLPFSVNLDVLKETHTWKNVHTHTQKSKQQIHKLQCQRAIESVLLYRRGTLHNFNIIP